MKTLPIEYVAGILDGEGTVTFQTYRGQSYLIMLRVAVSGTHHQLIRQLHWQFGGGLHEVKVRARARKQLTWQVSGSGAVAFLRAVEPFLVVKRKQAALAFKWAARRHRVGNGSVPPFERIRRTRLLEQMRALNKRGA